MAHFTPILDNIGSVLSFSYPFSDQVRFNAAWGSYYKLPIYTVLGFKNDEGDFANIDNEYINTIHYAAGFEYLPKADLRFTAEGFYKDYSNYPVSAFENISLANLGGGFGAIGNEKVTSVGGRRWESLWFRVFHAKETNQETVFNFFIYLC
ncbi:hypothetical protein [uncultured Arcticibacterium sp.]|uniref:hypothetical protein n=1 Tax=uncultured Arcticibacterium sp. TaxID=2173042 RepID=UPI0030F51D02